MRPFLSTIAAAVLLAAPAAPAATPDWSALSWLFGRWVAVGGGAEQGSGGFSFTPEAGGQVVARRNRADYPAQGGRPGEHHEDLMVIWREAGAPRAAYWDSEGHLIHYALAFPGPGEAVFVSDDPAGPRFRLSYRRTAGGLEGRFEVAPPDNRAAFAPYLAWTARRAP
jgi:hypothetical protein